MSDLFTNLSRNLAAVMLFHSASVSAARFIRDALDYDLRDAPDKQCDARLYRANMEAFKRATQCMRGPA